MSTLKVDTIRDNGAGFNDVVTFANSGGTENGRLCRAFVNFNGTGAVAIRASFNVNTITDNGTGAFTITLTNALSDANYSVSGSAGDDTGSSSGCWFTTGFNAGSFNASYTTTSFRVQIYFSTNQTADVPFIMASAFR